MDTDRSPEEERERQDKEEERNRRGNAGPAQAPSARPGPALLESNRLVVLYVSPLYRNKIKRDRQNKASVSLTKAPPLSKLGALST